MPQTIVTIPVTIEAPRHRQLLQKIVAEVEVTEATKWSATNTVEDEASSNKLYLFTSTLPFSKTSHIAITLASPSPRSQRGICDLFKYCIDKYDGKESFIMFLCILEFQHVRWRFIIPLLQFTQILDGFLRRNFRFTKQNCKHF